MTTVAASAATVAASAATVAASGATAAASAAEAGASTGAATGADFATGRARRAMKPHPAHQPTLKEQANGTAARASAQAVFPAPQELPVFGGRRAQDRLQGRKAVVAVHLGTRKDRAEPHYGGERKKAAGAGPRHQALALSRPSALRHQLNWISGPLRLRAWLELQAGMEPFHL